MDTEYIFLKTKHEFIDQKGEIFKASENGNVDDSQRIGNVISISPLWWKGLSESENEKVSEIWRNIWDK